MAAVAGVVHGTMAAGFDFLAVKIVVGLCGSVVMIIAGAVSARRSVVAAILTGLAMGLVFFLMRWSGWALMAGGAEEWLSFFATSPWRWPEYLAASGISGFWMVEAVSMTVPALIGCLAGQERPEVGASSAQSSS